MRQRPDAPRLDYGEYVCNLTRELLKFVDDPDDREDLADIGQRALAAADRGSE